MKQLRIGNERFAVASVKKSAKPCYGSSEENPHDLQLVKTEKNGTFEYCAQCRLTKQVRTDDDQ